MEEKITAIYYIKDLRTDKIIYIGQTINYKKRKRSHFGHKEQPIDKYMYEEGRENFTMELFDIDCTNMAEEERKQKEDELILQYDTINNGYNKRRSGLITKTLNYNNIKSKRFYHTEKCKQYLKEYYKTEKYKEYKKQYYKTEKYKEHKKQYRLKKKLEKLANETS